MQPAAVAAAERQHILYNDAQYGGALTSLDILQREEGSLSAWPNLVRLSGLSPLVHKTLLLQQTAVCIILQLSATAVSYFTTNGIGCSLITSVYYCTKCSVPFVWAIWFGDWSMAPGAAPS